MLRAFGWMLAASLLPCSAVAQSESSAPWYFAVSGDSRNCGDVVMPAIAEHAKKDHAAFYWHLGDFRAIYDFDDDYRGTHPQATIIQYEDQAWQDFIDNQLASFGEMPVYLTLGNHETIPPKTRAAVVLQMADWFDSPSIRAQRLKDDPHDHTVRAYYHWIEKGIDFISLDNSSAEQFDFAQMTWLTAELGRAESDGGIKTLVVGMHEALPDSIGAGHSMNESAQGTVSGRSVYQQLADFRKRTGKKVYVLASHSHFFMSNIYNTACRRSKHESVLPGWIVGTAGAIRYRLPDERSGAEEAQTDVYGYLLGAVSSDGTVQFSFKPLTESDVPAGTRQTFSPAVVDACFSGNKSLTPAIPVAAQCP